MSRSILSDEKNLTVKVLWEKFFIMKRSKVKLISFSALLIIILIVAFTPPGTEIHETKRIINAPSEIVWSVIADIENFHKYATALTGITILSGKGEGMVRACSDATTLLDNWTKKIKEVADDKLSLRE